MFERIKAYRTLKKYEMFTNGLAELAKIKNDEELLEKINETNYLERKIKKRIWLDRKMAMKINQELNKII